MEQHSCLIEMANQPNDELISRLDQIIDGLINGNSELGLPIASDDQFISEMNKVQSEWLSLKKQGIDKERWNPRRFA